MKPEELESTTKRIENWHNLIRERLKAVEHGGDSATIHAVNHHLDNIDGWKRISKKDPSDVPNLITWGEYVRSAEIYLCKLAGVEYQWKKPS